MSRPGRRRTGFRARRPGGNAPRREPAERPTVLGDPVALFSDLLRAWHGDLPWLELARRAEQGLAALLDAGGQSLDDWGGVAESRQSSPPLDTDEVSLQDIADAEARLVRRQAAFRSAADALESLHGQALARWPDLLAHPAAQNHTAELAELLLENSTRCLADDPRLAAAFAALAGLIRTRGPEHDERPADREQGRILQQLATAAYGARDLGPVR